MRFRIVLILGLTAALAISVAAVGLAGSGPKVTGGGQTDVGTSGAGDTIALTAQENPARGAIGQVQYIDREGGTGQGQVVYHGTVNCLQVEGNVADLSGEWRDGGEFEIIVEDNGSGDGTDIITLAAEAVNPDCGDDDDEDGEESALGRGNVTVHN